MKKKMIIILPIAAAMIIFLIALILFLSNTTNNLENTAKEMSFRNADDFYIIAYDDDGFQNTRFAVSCNGDESKGQELFVFTEKKFGLIKNTNRYTVAFQSSVSEKSNVGSLLYTLRNEDGKKQIKVFWFFTLTTNANLTRAVTALN